MARVNMTLDEIIAEEKSKGSGGRALGGRRRDRDAGKSSKRTASSGRWQHDLFESKDSGNGKDRFAASSRSVSVNRAVSVLFNNLASTVNTEDLQELVAGYGAESAIVHYDETGVSIGTAQVTLSLKNALDMMRSLRGARIDNQLIKMTLVDEASATVVGTIRDRVQFARKSAESDRLRKPLRGRVAKPSGTSRRRGSDAYDEHDHRGNDSAEERSGFAGGRGGRRGSRGQENRSSKKGAPMSEAELNRELDEYMGKDKDANVVEEEVKME